MLWESEHISDDYITAHICVDAAMVHPPVSSRPEELWAQGYKEFYNKRRHQENDCQHNLTRKYGTIYKTT